MKYIIMCGGISTTWNTPRQLYKINGEEIVARTIRLLRENGIEDISISSNDTRFTLFGVPVLHHENNYISAGYDKATRGTWCECFYPTDEPTVYLHGDVVFSREAIRKIIETETDDIAFFGSKFPFAPEYPKWYIEPFGWKVVDTDHLKRAVEDVKRLNNEGRFGRQPIAWEVWNVISRGPDGDVNTIMDDYVVINDWTCDIDYPEEAQMLEAIVERYDTPVQKNGLL